MIWARAEGTNIYDGRGKRYIDFTSGGIFAAILGNNHHGIYEAVFQQWADLISAYGAETKVRKRYEAMLKEFTGYESVALFSTGAEATEAFWRCMRVYTGKPGIWGGLIDPDEIGKDEPKPIYDSMHGWTLGALVMAGKMRLPTPGMFEALSADFLPSHEAASGMIMEAYHGPSAQFHRETPTMDRIRLLQKDFPDIALCVDEIQGGFGRTGKLFAHQWYLGTDDALEPKLARNKIDEYLKILNDDYRVERIAAIKDVFVEVLPSSAFSLWMKVHGKEGGANKFPRVLKKDQPAQWENFLRENHFKK